jgi:hypothetical protein
LLLPRRLPLHSSEFKGSLQYRTMSRLPLMDPAPFSPTSLCLMVGNPPPAGMVPSPSASAHAVFTGRFVPMMPRPPAANTIHGFPKVGAPRVVLTHAPPQPDPDGVTKPPLFMGICTVLGYIGSSPIYGPSMGGSLLFMGGLFLVKPSGFPCQVLWLMYGLRTPFLGSFLWTCHPTSTVRFLMGGLIMRLHLWHLCLLLRLLHCVL